MLEMLFVVVSYAHLTSTTSDPGKRNSSWQETICTLVVSRSLEHHTGERYDLARFHPNFKGEDPGGVPGASHLISPSTNLTKGIAAVWLFRVLTCRKGIIHLQPPLSSPGFEPWLYATTVSITNYYIGSWKW
ncbi:hypothetical protein TNCV_1938771 [Trichonephila clavipes]|nr:hypothetical protein TNCV_1938771 [Trichonephila clavipes]